MGTSLKGAIIIINFPFSDLSDTKRRPALVIADWLLDDVILCQITSVAFKDGFAVELNDADFIAGSLQRKSYIRPNKLFTADKKTFINHQGYVSFNKVKEVSDSISRLLNS